MNGWRSWAHGLGAAVIGAAATAGSAALAVPDAFNFSHHGLVNLGKVMLVPALYSALAYLKQSPLPKEEQTK